jgi:hypothetical protein
MRGKVKFVCIDGFVDSCGVHTGTHVRNITFVDKSGKKYFFKTLGGCPQIRYNTFADFRRVPPGKFCLAIGTYKFFKSKQHATLYAYKSDNGQILAFDDDFRDCAMATYGAEFWPRLFTGCCSSRTILSFRYIFCTCCALFSLGGLTMLIGGYFEKYGPWGYRQIMAYPILILMCYFFIGNHTIAIFRKKKLYRQCKQSCFICKNNIV